MSLKEVLIFPPLIGSIVSFFLLRKLLWASGGTSTEVLADLQMEYYSSSVSSVEVNQLLPVLFLALCASVWQVQTSFW